MIFLIRYNARQGLLVRIDSFEDADRQRAEDARLDLELDLNRLGIADEVVLLEAAHEDALRKTHARYFETLPEMIRRAERSSTGTFVVRETND
ncbi:MAG: hypothetical protein ABMA15_29840 [Vicinamibacterales bacterium]